MESRAATSAPIDSERAGFGAWYGLFVLILTSMVGNAIPQVMLLVTEAIKADLDLSDIQIGALRGIAVTLVVAIASYPISWLADRTGRRPIYAACILIWSLGAAATAMAGSYGALFACAMAIAAGEAVLGPVTFSIIPDLFQEKQRMIANSIFFISQLLGISAGLAIGGALVGGIAEHHAELPAGLAALAPWRLALMAMALPAIALIPMVLLIPLRKAKRDRPAADAGSGSVLSFLQAHPRTLFPVFIGFGAIAAANFTVFGWMAIAIVRLFDADPAAVGIRLSQVFAVGSIGGVVAANLLVRMISARAGDLTPGRVAQIGALVALLLCCLYPFARSPDGFYMIATAQIAASFGGLVLSPTLTQALAPAEIRTRLLAIAGLFYTLFGALSPVLVGAISDALGAAPFNLLQAMLIVALPGFAGGAILLRYSERGLPRTLAAVRA
ncbi:MFS transporter [Sphingomonas colocasiae]|uniref:MFS transporter n=1 Tax=Sphingomonas colocasiae TaxID=1848973 RepID=A0ABS7PN18_9SPHN|nr:MFS transporter [Sphingomonas colocasiae]MBY8822616.1 MFS transporter [Sphingomonas colocasiae]